MQGTTLPIIDNGLLVDRDRFFLSILRELAGTLADVVGLDQAEGYVSVVGQRIADDMNGRYRQALAVPQLSSEQIGAVLVDLKRRIGGDFEVVQQDDTRIVLRNARCPFGEHVVGRPALCMMTSNVFGSITAANLDYARVELLATFANGDDHCNVVVYLQPTTDGSALAGREYYGR